MSETMASDRYDYEDVKTQIHDFILANLAERRGVTSVSDDDSLLETGIVDSLGIFLIVSFLEETFHVQVGDDQITPDNFRTLAVISQMVMSKLQQKTTAGSVPRA